MVPAATRANLDHITSELVFALRKAFEFLRRGYATTMARQPRAEHIRDQDESSGVADRTGLGGGFGHLPGRPHQFGMGIADFVLRQTPFAILRNEMLAREPVVDLAWGT